MHSEHAEFWEEGTKDSQTVDITEYQGKSTFLFTFVFVQMHHMPIDMLNILANGHTQCVVLQQQLLPQPRVL